MLVLAPWHNSGCCIVLLALFFFLLATPAMSSKAEDVATLVSHPYQPVAPELAVIFDRRQDRVKPFLSWTFGWAQSYANSYLAFARVFLAVWREPVEWRKVVVDALQAHNHDNVRRRVTQPARDAYDIASYIGRNIEGRVFATKAGLLVAACRNRAAEPCHARVERAFLDDVAKISVLASSPVSIKAEISRLTEILDAGTVPGADLLHTMRPLASRLVVFIIRLTEITTLIVLITAGLRQIYVPNTMFTRSLVALAIAWGLDYAVLRVERFFVEDAYQEQLQEQLEVQRHQVTRYVQSRFVEVDRSLAEEANRILEEQGPWP